MTSLDHAMAVQCDDTPPRATDPVSKKYLAPPKETRDSLLARARSLLEMLRIDEADRLLSTARCEYASDPEIAAEWAMVPNLREDWQAAAARWRDHLNSFPELPIFWGTIAIASARAGLHREAETLMARALAANPGSLALHVDHAIVAQYAENWPLAVARWDTVLQLSPKDAAFQELRSSAIWHAGFSTDDSQALGEQMAAPAFQAPCNLPDFETIVTCFESLGDNCEFGLLQRRWGVEPLSLFRFSYVQADDLVFLLRQRLAPLGDPAYTKVEEDGNEYVLRDTRGYFWMHSFIRKGQMDEKKYLKQQMARIALLKRKLTGHLEAGDKIYICKDSKRPISDAMLKTISAGLMSYGPNLLLGIRVADHAHAAGSVTELCDGILVGYVSRLFANDSTESDVDGWARVLRQAHSFHCRTRTLLPQ